MSTLSSSRRLGIGGWVAQGSPREAKGPYLWGSCVSELCNLRKDISKHPTCNPGFWVCISKVSGPKLVSSWSICDIGILTLPIIPHQYLYQVHSEDL